MVGTHDNFGVMVETPEPAMDNHDLLDTKIMGIGGFFGKTMPEYVDFIVKANKVAAAIKDRGFKFTYHNHSHEFRKIDGNLYWEGILETAIKTGVKHFVVEQDNAVADGNDPFECLRKSSEYLHANFF